MAMSLIASTRTALLPAYSARAGDTRLVACSRYVHDTRMTLKSSALLRRGIASASFLRLDWIQSFRVARSMIPNTFFTTESFASLAGSAAIVFVVCNALQAALNFNPRWLALAVSQAVAIYGTWASGNVHVPSDFFISFLNGCLIFATATGSGQIASSAKRKGRPRGQVGEPVGSRSFLTPWF